VNQKPQDICLESLGLTIQRNLLPQVTKKPWGHERVIAKTDSYVVKEIFVKNGHRLSEQYHKKKTETMFLVSGNCWLEINGQGFNPPKLTPVYIPPKTIHRLAAVGDCLIVEISSTQLDDVVRLEDDYDRGE
jgi:mannose-6-phosphate isomerase